MTWQEVCDDPCLQDLPYKIELDQWGRIVMSPANNRHARRQVCIAAWLELHLKDGETMTECSVDTPMGTKVPDVAWASDGFIRKHAYDTPYPVAPEICVEIKSPSNSAGAIAEKIMLYLSKGAHEVWICDNDGNVTFHNHSGALSASALAPAFPTKL
jgi:Uma2 family endonuclease